MLRAAVYCRVSTLDQHPENQLDELHRYAETHEYTIVAKYVDRISGAKDSRPALNDLMHDARQHRFNVVLVWKIEEPWMCLLREFPVETNRKNDGFDFTVNSLKTFCETEFNGLTFFFSIPILHSESVSHVDVSFFVLSTPTTSAVGDRWCCEGYQ